MDASAFGSNLGWPISKITNLVMTIIDGYRSTNVTIYNSVIGMRDLILSASESCKTRIKFRDFRSSRFRNKICVINNNNNNNNNNNSNKKKKKKKKNGADATGHQRVLCVVCFLVIC